MLLDMGYWHQRYAYLFGRHYETHVSAYLEATIKPRDVSVDIGANIGFHVLAAAQCVGEQGSCIAVEPSRVSFDLLRGMSRLTACGMFLAIALHWGGKPGQSSSALICRKTRAHRSAAATKQRPMVLRFP